MHKVESLLYNEIIFFFVSVALKAPEMGGSLVKRGAGIQKKRKLNSKKKWHRERWMIDRKANSFCLPMFIHIPFSLTLGLKQKNSRKPRNIK